MADPERAPVAIGALIPARYKRPVEEVVAADVEADWRRAQTWAAACERGDCYFVPRCMPAWGQENKHCLHYHECPGWAGFKHIEEGKPLMRYRACKRRDLWNVANRIKVRDRRQQQVEQRRPVRALPPPELE